MKTALVTGATGMLGGAIVERLTTDGWIVRALVRDAAGVGHVVRRGAQASTGDLTDRESLRRAAERCDVIIHAAAAIAAGGPWETFAAVNVAGTSHLLDAAAHAGARVVLVSTTAVFGKDRYFAEPTCEDHPLPVLPAGDHYGRSKQEAERLVLEAHRRGRVWATVVRPPMMYGKHDRQFIPRVGSVMRRGVFPLIGGGHTRLSLASANAVADGAVLAAGVDRAGGRVYLLTNDTAVSVRAMIEAAAEGLGRPVRAVPIHNAVGRLGFGALGLALRMAGRPDLAAHAPGIFDMLTRDNPFTSARASEELGWRPQTDVSRALSDAFRYWRSTQQPQRRSA